jgi:hypothetical protein
MQTGVKDLGLQTHCQNTSVDSPQRYRYNKQSDRQVGGGETIGGANQQRQRKGCNQAEISEVSWDSWEAIIVPVLGGASGILGACGEGEPPYEYECEPERPPLLQPHLVLL